MRKRTSPASLPAALAFGLSLGLAAASCTVGEAFESGGGDSGGGVGSGGGGGGGVDAAVGDPDCAPAVTAGLNSGNHNPGQTCIAAGCHDGTTGDAPPWTAAGTLYSAVGGGAPVAGATIRLTDSAGLELELVTALNGNFYTEEPLTFPLTVEASRCPDTRQMSATVAQVQATGVSCNSGGCHDAANRMHVP